MNFLRSIPTAAFISVPLIVTGVPALPRGALLSTIPYGYDRAENSVIWRLDKSYYRQLAQRDAPPIPLGTMAWEGLTHRSFRDLLQLGDIRAAIAYVSGDATGSGSFASSITTSFAVASGTDRYLAAFNATWNTGTTCTGVTFNSIALSAVSGAASAGSSAPVNGKGWELIAPSVGTFNFVSTFNDANSSATAHNILYYTGVDQTTPSRAGNGSGVNSTSSSITVTSVANDLCVHFMWISSNNFHTFTAINSTVLRTTQQSSRRGSDLVASGTSTTLGWTWSTTDVCRFVAWPIIPAAAAAGGGAVRLAGPKFRLAGSPGGLAA